MPSERFANYHAEKARGGVALTVVEELPVSPSTRFALPRSIFAYDRESISGFRLMTERVHEFGALASAQMIQGEHTNMVMILQDWPSRASALPRRFQVLWRQMDTLFLIR